MNAPVVHDPAPEHGRTVLLIAYVLYAVEPFTLGTTAVVAVIINHLKVGEPGSEFLRSHHRWLLRTFWFTVLWSVVCGAMVLTLVLIPLAWIGFAVLGLWHLYRIVRGLLAFVDRRPMPV